MAAFVRPIADEGPWIPDADPQALRAAMNTELQGEFDVEWANVLEEPEKAESLEVVQSLLRKWQHTVVMECREPGAAQRLEMKIAAIRAAGGNPAGRSIEEMRACVEARLGR